MSTIKYLLDENVDPGFKKALKKHSSEIVVWCVGDIGAPSLGATDPDILKWCEANGFSLVTGNRASMPLHLEHHLAAELHIPGIFILNPKMSMGENADELALIWGASEPKEYFDQLCYLPISS